MGFLKQNAICPRGDENSVSKSLLNKIQKAVLSMKTKKLLACLMASLMVCGAFTACSDDKESESSKESSSESSSESSVDNSTSEDSSESSESGDGESSEPVVVDTPEFETAYTAESGDAYLAIVDGQWWIQYWGSAEDDGYMLAYDAGLAKIEGDGEYTVSVTADTNGFRYDTTGNASDQYTPSGCAFAAVICKDGDTLYPNMTMDITSIKIDGNEVPMVAEDFTCVDSGMRANIYNEWVADDALPEDAHDANGPVAPGSGHSAQIVDPAAFADGWTTVEVTFNVTGTGA